MKFSTFSKHWAKKLAPLSIFIFFSMIGVKAYADYRLPQLGTTAPQLSIATEQDMGKKFMAYVRQAMPINHDPFVTQYIQQLGARLTKSIVAKQPYYFFVVSSPVINAFAGPGGYIGVNSGLILLAQNEPELASVMAHEIAHVKQRHIAQMILAQQHSGLLSIGSLIAAAVLGAANPQAAVGVAAAAQAGAAQYAISFTRAHEEEADRVGMRLLAKAGFNPCEMPAFFRRMQKDQDDGFHVPEFLQTHPLTANRLADSALRCADMQSHIRPSDPGFLFIQSRLMYESGKNYSLGLLKQNAKTSKKWLYLYALTLRSKNKNVKSLKIIQALVKQYPNNVMLKTDQTIGLIALKKHKQGNDLFKDLISRNSNNDALILVYAHQLIKQKKYNSAITLLTEHAYLFHNNIIYFNMLATAQGKSGHLAQAYLNRAQVMKVMGNTSGAKLQLQQAERFANDKYMKARIQFELKKIARS